MTVATRADRLAAERAYAADWDAYSAAQAMLDELQEAPRHGDPGWETARAAARAAQIAALHVVAAAYAAMTATSHNRERVT